MGSAERPYLESFKKRSRQKCHRFGSVYNQSQAVHRSFPAAGEDFPCFSLDARLLRETGFLPSIGNVNSLVLMPFCYT